MNNVLIKPLITEKISKASEDHNKYGFIVALKANKNQIKVAVESFYDVKVLAVTTAVVPGKTKRTAKSQKKMTAHKKAIVSLASGQKIEFFKGI